MRSIKKIQRMADDSFLAASPENGEEPEGARSSDEDEGMTAAEVLERLEEVSFVLYSPSRPGHTSFSRPGSMRSVLPIFSSTKLR